MFHGDGKWDTDINPHRPIIKAHFSHRFTASKTLNFLIDTGADQTLIVPDHQKLLNIPENFTKFSVKEVDTIVGKMPFNFLMDCSLTFSDNVGRGEVIHGITVYFVPKEFRDLFVKQATAPLNRRPLNSVSMVYPSILGRDVLQKFCMGYCNPTDYLFLSDRNDDYGKSLLNNFPKAQPAPPPETLGKFIGTPFDIANLERYKS